MITMSWIAVHEEVLGGKLRGFRKSIGCSETEALGILTLIWLWARKNADISGLLLNVEKEDIARFITPSIRESLDAMTVTDALIESGWIDEEDGRLYIHQWGDWQKYWYNHLEKKEKDRKRKRLEREKETERPETDEASSSPPTPQPEPEEKSDTKEADEKTPKKKKKTTPPKIQYADNVRMKQSEYETLVGRFGEPFTLKLIETLDNYKGASGRVYKNDYKAILSWVVEKCEQKYHGLIVKQQPEAQQQGQNPFAQYK